MSNKKNGELLKIRPPLKLTTPLQETNCIRRWRKCASIVEEFVYQLNSASTGLTIGERKVMLRWFAENSQIIGLLLEFLKDTEATKEKLKFMSSVQQAYIQMVANRSIENSVHKNALLLVVVSSTDGPNQLFLACTLKATRPNLRKAIFRSSYIGARRGILGGILRKNINDCVSEDDPQRMVNLWDTTTTISPI